MTSTRNPSSFAAQNLEIRSLWLALWTCVVILTSGSTSAETNEVAREQSFQRERNPALIAVLQLPRETPGERFQTVMTLADLGEAELATEILRDLATLDLTSDQRAALVGEFGTASMLRLTRDQRLYNYLGKHLANVFKRS